MRKISSIFAILIPFLFPSPCFAHVLGLQYKLPLPAWIYIYGGATAVLLSFFIISLFTKGAKKIVSYPALNLSKFALFSFLTKPTTALATKIISTFIFLLVIIAGFTGNQFDASQNLATVFFWTLLLLGFTYLTGFVGKLWEIVNPWKVLTDFAMDDERLISYPEKLGYLPAFIFYYLIIWIELISDGSGTNPRQLSLFIILYTIISLTGSFVFGKKTWFRYFDFFTVFFGLIAKIAPLEFKDNKLFLRPPFAKLVNETPANPTLLLFILFMLTSTMFDGFRSTTAWASLDIAFYPIYSKFLGDNAFTIYQSLILFFAPLLFLFFYFLAAGLTKLVSKSKSSVEALALLFGFSLIPIAFTYNIAHYYTLLLTQGQSVISLISDPLGLGWNLFHTADYVTNSSIVNPAVVWASQVFLITSGNIAGAYVVRIISLRVFPSRKTALLAQLPTLLIMILLTMAGIWILSQPFTVR